LYFEKKENRHRRADSFGGGGVKENHFIRLVEARGFYYLGDRLTKNWGFAGRRPGTMKQRSYSKWREKGSSSMRKKVCTGGKAWEGKESDNTREDQSASPKDFVRTKAERASDPDLSRLTLPWGPRMLSSIRVQ